MAKRNCYLKHGITAAAYLRGKRYQAEKKLVTNPAGIGGKSRKIDGGQDEHHQKTAEKLADEYGVSSMTIRRNARMAAQIDRLAEAGGPQAKANVLSGKVQMGTSDSDVRAWRVGARQGGV